MQEFEENLEASKSDESINVELIKDDNGTWGASIEAINGATNAPTLREAIARALNAIYKSYEGPQDGTGPKNFSPQFNIQYNVHIKNEGEGQFSALVENEPQIAATGNSLDEVKIRAIALALKNFQTSMRDETILKEDPMRDEASVSKATFNIFELNEGATKPIGTYKYEPGARKLNL